MNWKINLLLFLLLIAFYKLYLIRNENIENFLNNNITIERDMNEEYSIKEVCSEKNPVPYYNLFLSRCRNRYIDLDSGLLKTPLYLYPSLYYHPLDEPE